MRDERGKRREERGKILKKIVTFCEFWYYRAKRD